MEIQSKVHMEYLLTPKNIQILETFFLSHPLLGFDYDGTLAPLSRNPSNARVSDESKYYLDKISKYAPVAIITGRSVEDVSKLLPFTPKYVIGNHGIEGTHSQDELETFAEIIQSYKKIISDQYLNEFSSMGIMLEDKIYSLSIHYRNSNSPEKAENFLITKLPNFPHVHQTHGKKVINIIPVNSTTKGQAFMQLLLKENTELGLFIGDDVTDEDVFIYKNPNLITIKVGFSEETEAGYYLENQEEVVKVLEIISKSLA